MKKIWPQRGAKRKNIGFKGGSPKNPFKFCSDSVCNNVIMQTAQQNAKRKAFLTFRKFSFSQGSMPYPTKMQKKHKSIPNRTFHQEKITNSVSHFFLCPLSLFLSLLSFFRGGGGKSSQLIWHTRGAAPKMSYEEGGGSLYTIGASSRIPPGLSPFPIKNERSLTQRHLKSAPNVSVIPI